MSAAPGVAARSWGRRAGLLTLGWLVALCALAAAGSARAEAKAPAEFFGVVPSEGLSEADFMAMETSGVRTLRLMFFWPVIEPSPGEFSWGSYDGLVKQAAEHDIRILPMLFGTPGWANFLAGRGKCDVLCAPNAEVSRDAFAAFAAALARRYGPGGEFWGGSPPGGAGGSGGGGNCGGLPVPILCRPEIAAPGARAEAPCECAEPLPITSWQIWNEQNSPKYYRPAPNPEDYAQLVTRAGAAIRGVDPAAEIVLGGMWGPPTADEVIPTDAYLRRLYATPGFAEAFDAVAVHPYAPNIRGLKQQMRIVRRTVKRAGDPSVAIWITELGWASGGPRNGLVKTRKAQARLLRKSFTYLLAKRRAWGIRGITWYSWSDVTAEQADCAWCPRSGLRSRSGAEKPAGKAFRRLALKR